MRGIGIDLCEIARIERFIQQTAGFLDKYYTEEEQRDIAQRGNVGAQSAAAMFAAKEAFLKAVGVGIGGGIALREIAIWHDAYGKPYYHLTGAALEKLGNAHAHISLTHEAGMAAAVCIID